MRHLLLAVVATPALLTSALRRQDERLVQEGRQNVTLSRFQQEEAAAQVPPGPQLAQAAPPTFKLWSWLRNLADHVRPRVGPQFMRRQTWRFATYQNASTQNWTNGSLALWPFRNVLLVVHCRVGAEQVTWREQHGLDYVVCRDREKMARLYAPYFGDIFYMTQDNHCPRDAADPTVCLARLMETRAANRDGIFYMHFDAVIDPVKLAVGFHKDQVYSFTAPHPCKLSRNLSMTDCTWGPWGHWMSAWKDAWTSKGHALIEDFHTAWLGNDDVFYIPRAAYALYAKLARGFAEFGLHHEVVGPTIRAYVSRQLHITDNNLNCTGGPMTFLTAEAALSPNFTCGHKFALSDDRLRRTLRKVIERR